MHATRPPFASASRENSETLPEAERVLTIRELNRATLARQLLLDKKRLSPARVIEHLVGMQAQWPSAPYLGIWTRTTSFRRPSLERLLVQGTIVKATVMRQTLHLVTLPDYGLIRAAMSETNFPWESELAKKLAPGAASSCNPWAGDEQRGARVSRDASTG